MEAQNLNDRRVIPQNKPKALTEIELLRLLNYDLAGLYFPMYIIQLRYDVFDRRKREKKLEKMDDADMAEDDLGLELHRHMMTEWWQRCKVFFILRDQWLLQRVMVTGTIVYYIKREEKHFFGIDDSTGVICCVLWLNDYSNQRGVVGQSRQANIRNWLFREDVKVGDTISILGFLESFRDKIQINVHSMRMVKDLKEEILIYQQTDAAQTCFFKATEPFHKRLFDQNNFLGELKKQEFAL